MRCNHCKGDIGVRNPMGFCDHLYYPEYCNVCAEMGNCIGQNDKGAK